MKPLFPAHIIIVSFYSLSGAVLLCCYRCRFLRIFFFFDFVPYRRLPFGRTFLPFYLPLPAFLSLPHSLFRLLKRYHYSSHFLCVVFVSPNSLRAIRYCLHCFGFSSHSRMVLVFNGKVHLIHARYAMDHFFG